MELDILVVEHDPAVLALLVDALSMHRLRTVGSLADARAALSPPPDLVLLAVELGQEAGLELAHEIRDRQLGIPVVLMTAKHDLDVAVDGIRAGAWDLLVQPIDTGLLLAAVQRAAELTLLRREVRSLRRQARVTAPFRGLVGESPPMRRLFRMIERVAEVSSSVLVRGESGTGKELVAVAIHQASPRATRPFVPLNCAAVPETLLEGELFGHTRGAFTDAHADRSGLIVQAHTGTLFLDEIGDMPLSVQAKLLRVLQERRVRPLGASRDIGVDVRIVAATHRDLDKLVDEGRFREDLLYRLDVVRLDVPPLRDRGTDILLLAQRFVAHFAERFGREAASLSPEACSRLLAHRWPGNVRELQNCMERAVVLCEGAVVGIDDLPERVTRRRAAEAGVPVQPVPLVTLAELERAHIERAMAVLGGHRGRVAMALGIDRKTLYRKLTAYKLT
jgi:DNA-binding NtrC family response regulator